MHGASESDSRFNIRNQTITTEKRRERLFCDLAPFISVPCTVFDFILQALEIFFRIIPPQIGVRIHQQLVKRAASKLLLRSFQWQVIDLLKPQKNPLFLFFEYRFKNHVVTL